MTGSTAQDRRLFEQLLQPPSRVRTEIAETEEIRHELYLLQPPYTRLGVVILQDIKPLERRPEGPLEAWAAAVRHRYTTRVGMLRSILVEGTGERRPLPGLTEDETTVQMGGVQRRLIQLAITGRISEQEYDSFVRRLQGP